MRNLGPPPRSSPFSASLAVASLCSLFILLGTMGSLFAATNPQPQKPRDSVSHQARLMKEVRHVLVTQPFYTVFDNLEYKIDGDRLTLKGQVVTPTLKLDAANAVKSIEGVSAVNNQRVESKM
jgi:hypothetical protein